jgi:futalosine hydrolase
MVNTAYHVAKYLGKNPPPDLAIHFGIAGSFDRQIPLGAVVEIVEDNFSELGAEDNGNFLDLEKMGFPLSENPILYNKVTNPSPSDFPLLKTNAITVNTVHGEQNSIDLCQKIWHKQIETMESAAFFQIMYLEKIPFYAFRCISNYVEPRNRANWKIGLAVKNMQDFMVRLIHSI